MSKAVLPVVGPVTYKAPELPATKLSTLGSQNDKRMEPKHTEQQTGAGDIPVTLRHRF